MAASVSAGAGLYGTDGGFGAGTYAGILGGDVAVTGSLRRSGGSFLIDHPHATSAVKRSVFLDDLVYSIATDRVKVQRMDRFGVDLADLSLQ